MPRMGGSAVLEVQTGAQRLVAPPQTNPRAKRALEGTPKTASVPADRDLADRVIDGRRRARGIMQTGVRPELRHSRGGAGRVVGDRGERGYENGPVVEGQCRRVEARAVRLRLHQPLWSSAVPDGGETCDIAGRGPHRDAPGPGRARPGGAGVEGAGGVGCVAEPRGTRAAQFNHRLVATSAIHSSRMAEQGDVRAFHGAVPGSRWVCRSGTNWSRCLTVRAVAGTQPLDFMVGRAGLEPATT